MVIDAQEKAKLWRAGDIGDVEVLHAKYVRYAFARHTHEGVAIDGAESFWQNSSIRAHLSPYTEMTDKT